MRYRVDDCRFMFIIVLSGERVGHDVLEAWDVSDVCGKLTDEGELVTLPI